MYDLNAWIQSNYGDKWTVLHGDDESYEETGFHLVQNDGATTYLYGTQNAVNTVADGICTFRVGYCLNRPEPAACTSGQVVSVDIVKLKIADPVQASAAETMTTSPTSPNVAARRIGRGASKAPSRESPIAAANTTKGSVSA